MELGDSKRINLELREKLKKYTNQIEDINKEKENLVTNLSCLDLE